MTAFSEIYDKFYELVETDSNFFQYFDLSENEVRNLVHDRAKSYLMESLLIKQSWMISAVLSAFKSKSS